MSNKATTAQLATPSLAPKIINLAVLTLIMFGLFLPWMSADISSYGETINAFSYNYYSPYSTIILSGTAASIVCAIISLIIKNNRIKKFLGIINLIISLILIGALGLCLLANSTLSGISSYTSSAVEVKTGIGLYLSLVCAIIDFPTTIIVLKTTKSKRS